MRGQAGQLRALLPYPQLLKAHSTSHGRVRNSMAADPPVLVSPASLGKDEALGGRSQGVVLRRVGCTRRVACTAVEATGGCRGKLPRRLPAGCTGRGPQAQQESSALSCHMLVPLRQSCTQPDRGTCQPHKSKSWADKAAATIRLMLQHVRQKLPPSSIQHATIAIILFPAPGGEDTEARPA